jgi:hypothetical protein
MLVDGERIGVSFLIVVLIIIEFLICCNSDEKYRLKQERNRRKKHSSRIEKYDEMNSDSDVSKSKLYNSNYKDLNASVINDRA